MRTNISTSIVLSVLALFISLTGCTTWQTVDGDEFVRHLEPNRKGEAILVSKASERTRLGPSSEVRVWRTDGTLSPWIRADLLKVTERGLLMDQRIPFRFVDEVRVAGLRDRDREYLATVAPPGCHLDEEEEDFVILAGCEGRWREWIDGYIVGVHTVWEEEPGYLSAEACCELASEGHCGVGDPWGAATGHLQCLQRLRGTRQWSFHVPGLGWLEALDDHELNRTVLWWLNSPAGIGFDAIDSVEIRNKSLWSVYGKDGPEPEDEIGLWRVGLQSPQQGTGAQRLFDSRTRRQAGGIFGVSLGTDSTFSASHMTSGSVALLVRLGRTLDIGGGYLHQVGVDGEGEREHLHVAFFRAGKHHDLNPTRTFALALFFDVGGGGPITSLGRYHIGMRWQVRDGMHLGAYPFNPQRMTLAEDYVGSLEEGWSFPSRLELSWTF